MTDTTPSSVLCPFCSDASRTFTPHGLKIHIGRMHKPVSRPAASDAVYSLEPQGSGSSTIQPSQDQANTDLDRLASLPVLRQSVRVLRHIPKGARNMAAAKLCDLIDRCLVTNGISEWCDLLMFSYVALKAPESAGPGNLTTKVKNNINSFTIRQPLADFIDGVASCRSPSIHRTIESKVFEGDLRGAVRVLLSDDAFAPVGPDTLASLQAKHPPPSRPLIFPLAPDLSFRPCEVKVEDVLQALGSFYNGSAAGLDGIRPAHLKELTSTSAGENGHKLLERLTKLCNFLLSGQLNKEVCPFIYGANLCALSKKDGGLRPIAIGSTLRRLVAKLGCRAVKDEMAAHLQPHQLGFGTCLGCEAAIHATRSFASDPANSDKVIVKLDIKNAFNSIERDVLLSEVRELIPCLYPFLHQVYECPSNLYYNNTLILSQVGAQQGDPLGPLVFSLAIQKIISDLNSQLNIWYLDDGTIGGSADTVHQDLLLLLPRLSELGLEVNSGKCEFFACSSQSRLSFPIFSSLLPGLREVDRSSFELLGSPIFPDAIPKAFECRRQLLLTAHERMRGLSAHVALTLLRSCFAVPRITYFLRSCPTWIFPEAMASFDEALKESLECILNVSFNLDQWRQASLPVRCGGLGVRCAQDVSLPAFLASAHGVAGLVAKILSLDGDWTCIPFASDALAAWSTLNPSSAVSANPECQRSWDDPGAIGVLDRLTEEASGVERARLKAVSQSEAGAWLHALPSPHVGTLLDSDSLRVAVALRLGCDVCERHLCICGSMVESNGHHALSCGRCSGRFPRHHALNEIVRRSLVAANIPCLLEPPGLSRSDGKRPDGLTLVPWQKGRCLLWDATCVNTFAASHLPRTVRSAGAAAVYAADRKRDKYSALLPKYLFVPIAVETSGVWGTEAKIFIKELGSRLRERGGDPRAGFFLAQRLSIAIQRGNAACVMGSFAPDSRRLDS